MMMRFAPLVVLSAVISSAPLAAQAPDPAAVQAGIARLDFMVGTWRGDAWQQRGAERVQTQMTEVVQKKLDGTVLLVEGRGTIGDDQVVHHALAIVSFDPRSGTYTMRSHIANGQHGDFALTVDDNMVSWSLEVPGGRVRNTARYTADEWHEVGEFSRDGTTWMQTMEMRLRRER